MKQQLPEDKNRFSKTEERELDAIERKARTRVMLRDKSEVHAVLAVAKALGSLGRDLSPSDTEAIARAEAKRKMRREKRKARTL